MTMVVSTSDVWMKSDAYHRVRISQSLQGFLSPLPLFTYLQPTTMLLQYKLFNEQQPCGSYTISIRVVVLASCNNFGFFGAS
jgi:hypothetical protein